MSATNRTANYGFPIFIGTDIPSWLIDWNNAMTLLDTAIAGAKTVADTAQTNIGLTNQQLLTLENTLQSLSNSTVELRGLVDGHTSNINGLNNLVNTQGQQIANVDANIEEIRSIAGWVYSGALSVGETTLTIDCVNGLSDDALVDIYIDVVGVTPEAVEVAGNLIKFTFAEQSVDVRVRVKVSGV